MIPRQKALEKLNELMANKNLIKHCLAVEAAMLAYADRFGIDEAEKEKWSVVGLLHDADYEKYPEEHPQVIIDWLRGQGADEDLINAVEAHGFEFGVEPKTLMAKTLRAADELTGLIVAVALVRPSKKLSDVTVESVLKKWGDKSFARGVKREDIQRGASEIKVPLEKHIEVVLKAMQEISEQLSL